MGKLPEARGKINTLKLIQNNLATLKRRYKIQSSRRVKFGFERLSTRDWDVSINISAEFA